MNYYIIGSNDEAQGPFDLVVILRKVRNQQIKPDTMILRDGIEGAVPASEIEEISSILSGTESGGGGLSLPSSTPYKKMNFTYTSSMVKGWKFMQTHQLSMLYGSGFVLMSLLCARLVFKPAGYNIIAGAFTFFVAYFSLSVIAIAILRLNRGQPLTLGFVMSKMLTSFVPLFGQALIVTVACMALPVLGALALKTNILVTSALFVPSMFIIALMIFAPFYATDQRFGALQSIKASVKLATGYGSNLTGVIFALVATNIIFGFAVISLIVLIPITLGALAEIYEESCSV